MDFGIGYYPPLPVSPADRKTLLEKSRAACRHSHSPYSSFPVGAATLSSDGRIFIGTNVENASYGLSICAERVAIFNAVTSGGSRLVAMAISIHKPVKTAAECMPCGACRQVMAEFMDRDAKIIVADVGDFRLDQLLPEAFVLKV